MPGAIDSSNMLPDPSTLTTKTITEAIENERLRVQAVIDGQRFLVDADVARLNGDNAVVLQRLDDIDRAQNLLAKTVDRVPSETDLKTEQLAKIINVQLAAIYTVLEERKEQARASAALIDTALQAALQTQKEAAASLNAALEKSIAVNSQATKETILKNEQIAAAANVAVAQLATNGISALEVRQSELKDTVSELRADIRGIVQSRTGGTATLTQVIAIIAVIATIALGIYAVAKP